jgi:hypothetical protein
MVLVPRKRFWRKSNDRRSTCWCRLSSTSFMNKKAIPVDLGWLFLRKRLGKKDYLIVFNKSSFNFTYPKSFGPAFASVMDALALSRAPFASPIFA